MNYTLEIKESGNGIGGTDICAYLNLGTGESYEALNYKTPAAAKRMAFTRAVKYYRPTHPLTFERGDYHAYITMKKTFSGKTQDKALQNLLDYYTGVFTPAR